MQILFVHGMGRSPASGWAMLRLLRQAGHVTSTLGYLASQEDFDRIAARLTDALVKLAAQGEYAVVGHSLGGVLLREAIRRLPANVVRPCHLFLLGSPVRPAKLAQLLSRWAIFKALTGDCGQLLASTQRMAAVEPVTTLPTTAIIGTTGLPFKGGPFGGEPNDGIVAASEVVADWLTDQVRIPVPHLWLPSSRQVADIVLTRLAAR